MMEFFLFSVVGLVSGFLSGLLGIGGGVIMVPALIFSFPHFGFHREVYVHMALATSSFCAFFFTVSGTIAHAKYKHISWRNVPFLGSGAFLGAVLGSTAASHTPGLVIKKAFGFFMLYVAYRLLFHKEERFGGRKEIRAYAYFLLGLFTGTVASFFGIGGGVIAVPTMAFLGFEMREAVGTSTAMIPFTTSSAALGYIVNGLGNPLLPDKSLGFVYLPAAAFIVPVGIAAAQLGAFCSSKIPQSTLRRLFGCLLLVVAVKMII